MTTTLPERVSGGTQKLAGKYLAFALHGDSYGVDVLKIRELIRVTEPTAVPQMPDYVKGVINLRGKIIPVMDLGLRFGFAAAASAEQNCTVVIQIKNPGGQVTAMGLGVDGVEEVAQIAASEIEEAPDFGAQIYTECVLGMAKLKSGVKTLLDIDQIISGEKVARLAATAVLPEAS